MPKKKPIDFLAGMIQDEYLLNILNQFSFDDTWIILPYMDLDGKPVALNRRSETARKAILLYKNNLYILKEVPWYCASVDFVNYETTLQHQLYKNGLPIPELLKSSKGHYWVNFKSKYYYLQRYIEGDSKGSYIVKIKSVGKNLALLHKQTSIIKIINHKKFTNTIFNITKSFIDILKEIQRKQKSELTVKDYKALSIYLDFSSKSVEFLAKKLVTLGYEKIKIPVHGDFNPLNLQFSSNNKVKAIFDFDNSCIDNPVHDVAEGLLYFCCLHLKNKTMHFSDTNIYFDKKLAISFLDAYKKENKSMYESLSSMLPYACAITILELYSLGLLRGDFPFSQAQNCYKHSLEIEKLITNIL